MQWAVVGCCLAALFALGALDEGGNHFVCPAGETGLYADPKSCKNFYHCAHGHVDRHDGCSDDTDFNPWTRNCEPAGKNLMCRVYVHPENHHERHAYYISYCKGGNEPHCSAHHASGTCKDVGLELVSILNRDEDRFLKTFTMGYEDIFHLRRRYTYWTSGLRTAQSSQWNRVFRWAATGKYLGYTDWCDSGRHGHMTPENCEPNSEGHKCVHLDTSYIESSGWWDAADCDDSRGNYAICEHNHNEGTTTHSPPSTTPTITSAIRSTTAPTPELSDEEFSSYIDCSDPTEHPECDYLTNGWM